MDASFIPLAYNLFPGNESEKISLLPIFNKTRRNFNLGRTIVVADRGLNTSDNIIKISGTSLEEALKRNGYVYGQSVRGSDEEFKLWVLDQNDYITETIKDDNGKEIIWKHKSRIYPKKMYVIREVAIRNVKKYWLTKNKWYIILKNMLTNKNEIEI